MTDREPVTAILEGGRRDGREVQIDSYFSPYTYTADVIGSARCVSELIETIQRTDTYQLLSDDYGRPMRDPFGRYRYRIELQKRTDP